MKRNPTYPFAHNDYVRPKKGRDPLVSSAAEYHYAIVKYMEPFTLVF